MKLKRNPIQWLAARELADPPIPHHIRDVETKNVSHELVHEPSNRMAYGVCGRSFFITFQFHSLLILIVRRNLSTEAIMLHWSTAMKIRDNIPFMSKTNCTVQRNHIQSAMCVCCCMSINQCMTRVWRQLGWNRHKKQLKRSENE